MPATRDTIMGTLLRSIEAGRKSSSPYPHWVLTGCVSEDALDEILALPFPAPSLGGVSGKRELHNATRRYFDQDGMARHSVCKAFNDAFQSREVTGTIERTFGSRLAGTYLRVEYAQDTDGFWLEPHTDLGVKAFTMLLYASRDPEHATLGTDIYDSDKRHIGRSPFVPGGAMVFVPSTNTYHGFEPRTIKGVRKSIIINYVTNDWRAREQLAFPDRPVS